MAQEKVALAARVKHIVRARAVRAICKDDNQVALNEGIADHLRKVVAADGVREEDAHALCLELSFRVTRLLRHAGQGHKRGSSRKCVLT